MIQEDEQHPIAIKDQRKIFNNYKQNLSVQHQNSTTQVMNVTRLILCHSVLLRFFFDVF